jgi:hypothetical protein
MANIGKTEVDAASLEIVSQLVNLNLTRSLVMPGKLTDLSSEAQPGLDKIKIRKFTDLAVSTKAENSPVTYGISTLSTDDLLLDQHKYVALLFEKFAKIQGPQTFLTELAQNAAVQLALAFDAYLVGVVNAGAATGSLPNAGTIDKEAFIEARKELNSANVPAQNRYVGVHPDDYAEVLKIASFVNAEAYGTSSIPSGVVGTVFGMNVVENTAFTPGEVLAWHGSCAAVAMQLTPTVQTQFDLDELADKWIIDTIYGAKIIKAAAAIKLI